MNSIVPIILGFALTTVVGGLLGTRLQQRLWDHQRSANLVDRELEKADEVCQRISRLMDKRLYRMLRLYYAMRNASTFDGSIDVINARLQDYDSLLYEWNDQLNLNLALIGTYFGYTARDWLHLEIYEAYQVVGVELEAFYQQIIHKKPVMIDTAEIELHLNSLNDQVYRLGIFMMTQLRGGHVGRAAPRPILPNAAPELVASPPVTLPGIAFNSRLES